MAVTAAMMEVAGLGVAVMVMAGLIVIATSPETGLHRHSAVEWVVAGLVEHTLST